MDDDLTNKIVNGLERLSEVFKSLLWEKSKVHGISPIQIQILLFIANHRPELCNVSHLAREFNLTKPTISDATRVLHTKGLLDKDFSSSDGRSYNWFLTSRGKELIGDLSDYPTPLRSEIEKLSNSKALSLFTTISELIYKLNQNGILNVQRTCFGCRFYEKSGGTHYCKLLEKRLAADGIRLDCPEYEERS